MALSQGSIPAGRVHRVSDKDQLTARQVMAFVDDYTQGLLSESQFLKRLGFDVAEVDIDHVDPQRWEMVD